MQLNINIFTDDFSSNPLSPTSYSIQPTVELGKDNSGIDEGKIEKTSVAGAWRTQNYVSQTAVALRCRVMPPPCIKNPYIKDASEFDMDPFRNQRSKCAGIVWLVSQEALPRQNTLLETFIPDSQGGLVFRDLVHCSFICKIL